MLRPRPNVISETIDDEVIMIDLETGMYYSLMGTASQVWNAIEAGGGRNGTVTALTARYGDAVAATITAFVGQLLEEGLLVDAPGEEIAVAPPNGDQPFAAPALERYTDMAGILLLDPVHEVDEEVGWPQAR